MTAKSLLKQNIHKKSTEESLIEFAQYHVQECIKNIVKDNAGNMNEADIPYLQKSYPLENIK